MKKKQLREENKRLRTDCGELYQVISSLESACSIRDLKAAGIGAADITRALDNALAAFEGRQRPHNSLLPWPKEKNENNGHYIHRSNNKNKRSIWLPEGVSVTYRRQNKNSTIIYFSVNYVKNGKPKRKHFYAGTLGLIEESRVLFAQNIAINFRNAFKEACLRNIYFDDSPWALGRWRKFDNIPTGIKPPRPYTSVDTLDELVAA